MFFFFLTQFLCQAICTQRTPKGLEGNRRLLWTWDMYPPLPGIELTTCSVSSGSRSHYTTVTDVLFQQAELRRKDSIYSNHAGTLHAVDHQRTDAPFKHRSLHLSELQTTASTIRASHHQRIFKSWFVVRITLESAITLHPSHIRTMGVSIYTSRQRVSFNCNGLGLQWCDRPSWQPEPADFYETQHVIETMIEILSQHRIRVVVRI